VSAARFLALLAFLLAGCAFSAPAEDPATAEAALQAAVAATTTAIATRQARAAVSSPASTPGATPASAESPPAAATAAPATPAPVGATASPATTPVVASARTPTAGTPGPRLSAEEAAYVRSVIELMQEFNRSYDRFRSLVEAPRMTDASWRLELEAELTLWTNGAEAARSGQAPPAFQTAHERIVNGLLLYGQAARQIREAMDAGGNELARQGLESVTQARRSFAEAETELNRIARERGL
jgi:hypothetical protein